MIAKIASQLSFVPRALWVGIGVLGAALVWAYWPTFTELARRWTHEPQYSHGYLVPFFALALLCMRHERLSAVPFGCSWWGAALVGLGVFLRLAGTYLYVDWLDGMSLLPCLAGLTVLFGGAAALRWAWPAIAFLAFMIPLPFQLEVAAALPLQRLATSASTYALQTLGLSAFADGNTIHLENGPVDVVRACSGLSMLMISFALATGLAMVVRRVGWEKLVLVASAIPIALFVNIVRITATGVLRETAGPELAEKVYHDLAGWLMMPLALVLLVLEMWVLSRLLVVPSAPQAAPAPPAPAAPAAQPPAKRRTRNRKRHTKPDISPVPKS